jgi:FkbM family methyltransferase
MLTARFRSCKKIVGGSDMASVMRRFVSEYAALGRVLEPSDMFALGIATVANAPTILRTKKLTDLDAAMRRNMTVKFDGSCIALPIKDIDKLLEGRGDNPTFGNVREIYARNCYLDRLKIDRPVRAVLDGGANRGMFSILALTHLGAEIAVGVEPIPNYIPVFHLLLNANGVAQERAPRYQRFLVNPSTEKTDPEKNISIQTILREQKVDRFQLVKIDIEGFEKALFSEPDWLARVDTICMELHPHFVGDLSVVPETLKQYGFEYRLMNQEGEPTDIRDAMFLQASCTGALA